MTSYTRKCSFCGKGEVTIDAGGKAFAHYYNKPLSHTRPLSQGYYYKECPVCGKVNTITPDELIAAARMDKVLRSGPVLDT